MNDQNTNDKNNLQETNEQVERSVQQEHEKTEGNGNATTTKLSLFRYKKVLIAVIAVLLAVGIGLGIYNTPANRTSRLLELGQQYLTEQNYEEAILAFNQAIEIDDRCLEAYVGGIEAYLNLGNMEELETFYERALEASRSLEGEVLAENIEYVTAIYLSADEVYPGDLANIVEILGEGLSVNSENEELLTDMSKYLTEYLEVLIEQKSFEEVKALIEKYRRYPLEVDFDGILAKIEELERIEAENLALMQKVYDAMAAEDYETMRGIDGSEEAEAFVSRMEGESYSYIPEGGNSGVGAGIYLLEEDGYYYFYYGDYQSGQRVGKGSSFYKNSEEQYTVFTGEWKNDAPNGYGEEQVYADRISNTGELHDDFSNGNLINGLWDGSIYRFIIKGSETYDLSWVADKGIPTEDRTEEFFATYPWFHSISGDVFVYAYDNEGYSVICSTVPHKEPMGIVGFE